MAVLKLEIYKYRLMSSSLTAEGVRTPRSVKRKKSDILGRSVVYVRVRVWVQFH